MPKKEKKDNLYQLLAIFSCSVLIFTVVGMIAYASTVNTYNKSEGDLLEAKNWNQLSDHFLFKNPPDSTFEGQTINDNIGINMPVDDSFDLTSNNISANLFTGKIDAKNVSQGTFGSEFGGGNFYFSDNLGFNDGQSITVYDNSKHTELLLGNYLNEADFLFGKNYSASLLVEGDLRANQLCIKNDCKENWSEVTDNISLWQEDNNRISPVDLDYSVGIGTITPEYLLDVDGMGRFVDIQMNNKMGTSTINMNDGNIIGVEKITVGTIDPLYRIDGINYSTFASAIVGGVKEELISRAFIDKKISSGEYEHIIDFKKEKEGSDLWVWFHTIDWKKNNIDVLITPYGGFAKTYYLIEDQKLILRSNKPIEVSYRLMGKRFDWRNWPTKADDQKEKPSFTIETK